MQSLFLLIWLTVCAAQDARQRHIANALTLGVGGLALAWMVWTGSTWLGAEARQGGLGFLLALAFTLPGYWMGRLGAGDVKLVAAIGLATDGMHVLGTIIGAGLTSVFWLLAAPKVWLHMNHALRDHLHYMAPGLSKKQPFAPFILAGMVLTILCAQRYVQS